MQNKFLILFIVLSILPFSTFAQNKKPIPAGRYEALSGIKNNRNVKNGPELKGLDMVGKMRLFWLNAMSYLPEDKILHPNVFVYGDLELDTKLILDSKGVKYVSKIDSADVIYSDNITRDIAKFSKSNKNVLYVIEEVMGVRELISLMNDFELLSFSHNTKKNLYLLKLKSI